MTTYSNNKFKILLTFTVMILYFLLTLMSFSRESNVTQPFPRLSKKTGHDDGASRIDSLHHEREHHVFQWNTTKLPANREIIKNVSSRGSPFILKKPVAGWRQQPRIHLKTEAKDHLRHLPLSKQKSAVVTNARISQDILTNLSLSFQASQLRFERDMAKYGQREIGQPVRYSRENIPADLRALAPGLFSQFPRTFLPDYKSPCWKFHNETISRLRCLPYFFIGGFPKCATTDLWGKLMTHPALVRTTKEPHWWTRTNFEEKKIETYVRRYNNVVKEMNSKHRKDLITCDASALTFQDNKALIARMPPNLKGEIKYVTADFIRTALPDLKIVGIMRDPTARLYSAYLFFAENKKDPKSPEDFHVKVVKAMEDFYNCTDNHDLHFCAYHNIIPHINIGCYSFYIREYLARFPRDQLYFLRTEDWSKYPAHYMKEIYSFLDIDPMSEEYRQKVAQAGKLNRRKSRDRRVGPMLPQTKKLLDDFYRPCNKDLAKLLNDDKYLWQIGT